MEVFKKIGILYIDFGRWIYGGIFEDINKRLKFKGIITVIVLVVLGGLLIGCGEEKTRSTTQEIGEKF